jgi:hypothetical protein
LSEALSFVEQDIPALAAEAAKKHPGVSYLVTAPIGLHKSMVVRAYTFVA